MVGKPQESETTFTAECVSRDKRYRPYGDKAHRSSLWVVMNDLPLTKLDIPAKPLVLDVEASAKTPSEGPAFRCVERYVQNEGGRESKGLGLEL
jgi:hypothetical protein